MRKVRKWPYGLFFVVLLGGCSDLNSLFYDYATLENVEFTANECDLDNWLFSNRFGFGTGEGNPNLTFTVLPEAKDFVVKGGSLQWDTSARAKSIANCVSKSFERQGVYAYAEPIVVSGGQICPDGEVPDPTSIQLDNALETMGFGARFDCIPTEDLN